RAALRKYRIVQWCTGGMGRTVMREVIDRPEFELVGVYVTNEKKVGLDAGTIVRRPETGVIATGNIEDILALEADAVIHTSLLKAPYERQNENVIRLLESGKNVLSPNGFVRPQMHDEAYCGPLREAAMKGKATLAGVGLNPGFAGERLALVLSGLVNDITEIRTQEVFDSSQHPSAEIVQETIGFGLDPKDSDLTKGPIAEMYNMFFPESMDYVAEKLGTRLVSVTPEHEVILAPHDIEIKVKTIQKGTVAAINWQWRGKFESGKEMVVSVLWTASQALHGDIEGGHVYWKIEVDGRPNVRSTMSLHNTEPNAPAGRAPMQAMAAIFLNAVPLVVDAPPGFFDLPSPIPSIVA
ncbi:MAG: hypothetical protein KDJ36_18270, partial [Hyphomicrobiaceae bacterium]|nr:hypothetical protein [Hyphomicrobiaceae bacterium]